MRFLVQGLFAMIVLMLVSLYVASIPVIEPDTGDSADAVSKLFVGTRVIGAAW